MKRRWAGTTFGNGWMHKWLVRMCRYLDLRIIYAFVAVFVVPVCLVVNPSAGITYRYFRKRHGYGTLKAAWKTYVNHCLFGQVVIDKFAMYAGKKFKVDVEGYEHYRRLAGLPQGFLQLSAHIGNYEIAGYTLTANQKPFNALVFFGEKESVMKNRENLFGKTNINMIAIRPDMGHLFEISEALNKGESVSMPADRLFGSEKKLSLNFLGATADFPLGPFSLASMQRLDVLAVNVVKTGMTRYKILVTPLPYDKTAKRKQQVEDIARAYVEELQRVLSRWPTQWYNYFDFWSE